MENWDRLDFERNVIEGSAHMTFAAAKVRIQEKNVHETEQRFHGRRSYKKFRR